MIDWINPNSDKKAAKLLQNNCFNDFQLIHTSKHPNIVPFGITKEAHY